MASGATFDLFGGTQTLASLSDAAPGQGGTVLNSNSGFTSILTLSPTGGATTFSGLIAGGGTLGNLSLVMAGTGLQNLAGVNTYTGGTRITGGTLQLGNAAALGTGAVAANGGVFDLAGLSVTVPSFSGASGVVTTQRGAARCAHRQPDRLDGIWRRAYQRRRRALAGLQRRQRRPAQTFTA